MKQWVEEGMVHNIATWYVHSRILIRFYCRHVRCKICTRQVTLDFMRRGTTPSRPFPAYAKALPPLSALPDNYTREGLPRPRVPRPGFSEVVTRPA